MQRFLNPIPPITPSPFIPPSSASSSSSHRIITDFSSYPFPFIPFIPPLLLDFLTLSLSSRRRRVNKAPFPAIFCRHCHHYRHCGHPCYPCRFHYRFRHHTATSAPAPVAHASTAAAVAVAAVAVAATNATTAAAAASAATTATAALNSFWSPNDPTVEAEAE